MLLSTSRVDSAAVPPATATPAIIQESSKRLHLTSRQVPPGGMHYRIVALAAKAPREAWVGPFNDSDTLLKEVNRREKANALPLSTLEDVEDQVCQRAPPGYCRDASGQPTTHPGSLSLTLPDVVAGTKALVNWFKHGSVTDDEIRRRTAICNACPENMPISGCQGCAANSLHAVMNAIVVRSLPSDAVLHACRVCKCSLKAKVRLRLDDLPSMTKEQRDLLPPSCWIVAPVNPRDIDPRL